MQNNNTFEDLEIWKEGMRLCVLIHNEMKIVKDYTFRDHIKRSAVSIPSNISEGSERQTNKEFIRFLYIAKASCGELRTQIHLADQFEYLTKEKFVYLLDKCKALSSKIQRFIEAREKFI